MLELNAIPGFTESSLLPKAAAAAGFHFQSYAAVLLREPGIVTCKRERWGKMGFLPKSEEDLFFDELFFFL